MNDASRQPIRSHRDLIVWQKAMRLRRQVHLIVEALPSVVRFEIGAQLERCALSIPANIAEGHSRPARQDYKQFLSISRGSAGELDTHLLAVAQDYPTLRSAVRAALALLVEILRMLSAIIKKL